MESKYLNNHCVHPNSFGDACCKCGASDEELNNKCKGTALHHEVQASNWEKVVYLNGQKAILQNEINNRKQKAIKELREMGYSFDSIAGILHTGKVTAIRKSKEGVFRE